MRLSFFLVFLSLLVSIPCALSAQEEKAEKNPRILILLDGSSSMMKEWTRDKIRFEAAARIVDRLMDSVYSVNKNVEFALRVYGHQHPTVDNDCHDTQLEVMFSRDNYTQMMLRLADITPLGVSPIAYSLQQAAESDLVNLRENKYSLILITDGGESCEGDICQVVAELLNKKIDFKPYILSLVNYAPLAAEYKCLGDYLLVTSPEEIDPVVGKIVESYRRTFIQPTTVTKLIETTRTNTPSVLKVKTPDFKVEVTDEPEPKKEEAPPPPPPPAPVVPKTEPTTTSKIVVLDATQPRKPDANLQGIRNTRARSLPIRYTTRAFAKASVPAFQPPVIEVEPERPTEPVYRPMPATTTQGIASKPATKPKPSPIQYTVTREDAQETTLEIFLGDGRGTYYESAPEIVLLDSRTGAEVHRFSRDVDAYGQPRPQKNIPPGTYDITFPAKKGFVALNVEVREFQKNKILLVVPDGSLTFFYETNLDRPVKEFNARVGLALKRGQINKQLCADIIYYPPGNYHIEINTNPPSHFNTDLDFGAVVEIGLPEPGKIVINNPNEYRNVQFLYQHGDRFEEFRPSNNIMGDIRRQEFLIQPNRYKILYEKRPDASGKTVGEKAFTIKSNTITEITLD